MIIKVCQNTRVEVPVISAILDITLVRETVIEIYYGAERFAVLPSKFLTGLWELGQLEKTFSLNELNTHTYEHEYQEVETETSAQLAATGYFRTLWHSVGRLLMFQRLLSGHDGRVNCLRVEVLFNIGHLVVFRQNGAVEI